MLTDIGAKNQFIISVNGIERWLDRLPAAAVGDMVTTTVKKGKPNYEKRFI